ncbi:ArsR/SmtB family transcription factor [Billgrantia endophytica]|uniref:Transcriptional regulator n=1 Tax=Billgrantia endophytica TaxID=2033802 RepID=A0A2N7TYA5_9GAMM|nr:metalloregulator ArsR/SmtB family transcription factor [Halomonas endophytica]PMR73177.1 transcriptional regulator [Halomonas endophytica]
MPDTSQLDINEMRDAAAAATGLLRALAHEDRLLLLCQLSQEELCVSDLEARLGIHQPSLSQQLGVLRKQGLVATRREGKHIFYRIADGKALALLQVLYTQFCTQAEADGPITRTAEFND